MRQEDNTAFIAQSGAQEFGLSNTADIVVFGGNRGGGKANSLNTLVATPNGYKKMGQLEMGDEIREPGEDDDDDVDWESICPG